MELCVNTSNLKFTPDVTSDGRGKNVTWNYIKLNLTFIDVFAVLSSDKGIRIYEIFGSLFQAFTYLVLLWKVNLWNSDFVQWVCSSSSLYNLYLIHIFISFILIYFAFFIICFEKILVFRGCSGGFRGVPRCSRVFRGVPGFTDTHENMLYFPVLCSIPKINQNHSASLHPGVKWVPANLLLGVTLQWTSIPSRGE